MNSITLNGEGFHTFERNNKQLRSESDPNAVNLVLDLFGARKNYISYPLKDGKRYRSPITVSDAYLAKKEGWKPPKFLNDQMIINAMEGSINYMYGVGFANSYKDEEGIWRNDYEIDYGLLDLDHKEDRELDYYSTPEIIVEAFAKYDIKVHITESSETGKHCYFFLNFREMPNNVARVMAHICRVEKLKVANGLLELFPRVKAKGKSMYKGHRLPCQPGSSHNIEEFAKLILHGKSSITKEKFKELLNKSFTRNPSKDKYFDEINKGWTRHGMTQWLTLKIAIWHRIYGEYETLEELKDICINFAINAPGYRKYCGHQDEIEKVFDSKLAEVWVNNSKHSNVNRYTKREELEKERVVQLKALIKKGYTLNQMTKELKADKRTVKKLVAKHNLTINSQNAQSGGGQFTDTSLLRSNKISSIGDFATTTVQNEKTLEERILALPLATLDETLNQKGNVTISKLASALGCHRNSIKLSKEKLTQIITTHLNKENYHPTPCCDVVTSSKISTEAHINSPKTANKPSEVSYYKKRDEEFIKRNYDEQIINGRRVITSKVKNNRPTIPADLVDLYKELVID